MNQQELDRVLTEMRFVAMSRAGRMDEGSVDMIDHWVREIQGECRRYDFEICAAAKIAYDAAERIYMACHLPY